MPLRGENPRRPTYEIQRTLPGGKAMVVVANHRIFGRLCVQKVVDVSQLSGHTAFQEPQLLDRIQHPQITPIDEVQWDPEAPAAITFVMPLYEGGSVASALSEGHRFSMHGVIAIGADVADALSHVHVNVGFIHRDMKPGNILMDAARDHGYLTDFGSAARIDGADGTAPATTATLPYMPPEAITSGRIGPPGDVYGLGFVLYEMLCGPIPWQNDPGLPMQQRLMRGQRSLPEAALNVFPPHVPEQLRRVVRKALRRGADERQASAGELLHELRALRVIDWRRLDGDSLVGEWQGTWPPHLPARDRFTYRVMSRVLGSGRSRGRLRLEAHYRRPERLDWRTAGVPAETCDPADPSTVTQFFAAVAARAAQRTPAR